MALVELDRVSKVYRLGVFGGKKLRAVHEVSFAVEEGQVFALIGESGSGKTTIGRLILRTLPVTSGRVLFRGADIASFAGKQLRDYYRRVQGVFQDPYSSFNPIFKADRVFAVVRHQFFPRMGEKDWSDRVHKTLRGVGLDPREVLGKYPHQLSGGQLQRFLIARALLLDVEFLVADEIISMLDATTRVEVLNLLADLTREQGLSILFITHDMALGYYISGKVVILYRGCAVEQGDVAKVFNNPIHPYTTMLMASVPRLDRKWEEGELRLKGQEAAYAQGCAFYERCPFPYQACRDAAPHLVEVEDEHFVACQQAASVRR